MSGRAQRFIGVGLLVAVALVVAGVQLLNQDEERVAAPTASSAVVVRGLIGSEKEGFLQNPEVQQRLRDEYDLTVDFGKVGSLEMVRGEVTDQDFLWPSSQVALELFRERHGGAARSEILLNSPIVLYAWGNVTDALVGAGLVVEEDGVYYADDFARILSMIDEGTPWSDLGLANFGGMAIFTTDPTRSNSGNMFAGLMVNTLNGGTVVDESTIETYLPTVRRFYDRLGLLEGSSGPLFEQFLTQGEGARPIIAGYESQLIEFGLANADQRETLQERINVIYPRPTVFSAHPMIALTPAGERLKDALRDPELQRLAWERHGFRTGLTGIDNDPAVFDVGGVPETVQSVIPMPRPAMMDRIIATLEEPAGSAPATTSEPEAEPTTDSLRVTRSAAP